MVEQAASRAAIWLLLVVLAWLVGPVAAAPDTASAPLSAQTDEPRAYGYFVGDRLQRRVHLSVPPGLVLDMASLPRTRRPGQALELRRVQWSGGPELLLEYQVFLAPAEVTTLEAPPLKLRFTAPGGEQLLRVDAWPVTVAPLLPLAVSPRTGLGELRPELPPPLLDTGGVQQRLLVYAALLTLAGGYLAVVYLGLPWLGRRRRPFAQAWQRLRAVPDTGAATPAAFQCLHSALNASAGRVLFAAGVDSFLAEHSRYAGLRAELLAFFAASNAVHFGTTGHPADPADARALRQLARALRDAERGS